MTEQQRYYSADDINAILAQARRAYHAWTRAPVRVVAVEMYALALLLGEVERGNGRGNSKTVAVDTLPDEATEGLTCSLSGG